MKQIPHLSKWFLETLLWVNAACRLTSPDHKHIVQWLTACLITTESHSRNTRLEEMEADSNQTLEKLYPIRRLLCRGDFAFCKCSQWPDQADRTLWWNTTLCVDVTLQQHPGPHLLFQLPAFCLLACWWKYGINSGMVCGGHDVIVNRMTDSSA